MLIYGIDATYWLVTKVTLQKQTFQAVKLDCFGLLYIYGALMGVVRRTRGYQGRAAYHFLLG